MFVRRSSWIFFSTSVLHSFPNYSRWISFHEHSALNSKISWQEKNFRSRKIKNYERLCDNYHLARVVTNHKYVAKKKFFFFPRNQSNQYGTYLHIQFNPKRNISINWDYDLDNCSAEVKAPYNGEAEKLKKVVTEQRIILPKFLLTSANKVNLSLI